MSTQVSAPAIPPVPALPRNLVTKSSSSRRWWIPW